MQVGIVWRVGRNGMECRWEWYGVQVGMVRNIGWNGMECRQEQYGEQVGMAWNVGRGGRQFPKPHNVVFIVILRDQPRADFTCAKKLYLPLGGEIFALRLVLKHLSKAKISPHARRLRRWFTTQTSRTLQLPTKLLMSQVTKSCRNLCVYIFFS